MFFHYSPRMALLADSNSELMNAFSVVRDNPVALAARLLPLPVNERIFGELRSWRPSSKIDRAVRFIYLNRTAFNGIYRVNARGHFNVPFGCHPTTIACDTERLLACSNRLRRVEIQTADFRATLRRVGSQSHAFVDPPYTVKHNLNAFRRYNESLFSWSDQEELAAICTQRVQNGARLVVSNAAHRDVADLYDRTLFWRYEVSRSSRVAAAAPHRGGSEELLLISRTLFPGGSSPLPILRRHHGPRVMPYRARRSH